MKRSRLIVITLVALIVASISAKSLAAQQPAPGTADPFARFLFPPELIMQHQAEIAMTEAQRTAMATAMGQAQTTFVVTQVKLALEGEKLAHLLQGTTVDETQALEQVDRILSLERDMKRAQVALLVRLKNGLTPTQQTKLAALKQAKE
jgi:Spy/CpxP family protein refolding chaperone